MSEGDQRLEQVQERIDEAHEAADAGRPRPAAAGRLRRRPDGSAEEQGAFEPAGDDADAGGNPAEGDDADTPGAADDARAPEASDEAQTPDAADDAR